MYFYFSDKILYANARMLGQKKFSIAEENIAETKSFSELNGKYRNEVSF